MGRRNRRRMRSMFLEWRRSSWAMWRLPEALQLHALNVGLRRATGKTFTCPQYAGSEVFDLPRRR